MLNFFKKILITGICMVPQLVFAQSVDIPDVWDEEEEGEINASPVAIEKVEAKPVPPPQKTVEPQQLPPNLGRNETPLTEIQSPFPKFSINIKETEPTLLPEKKEWAAIDLTNSQSSSSDFEISPTTTPENISLDVRDYEIEGFSLGLTPIDVAKIAIANGYKITKSKKELPLFMTTRYEQKCRLMGYYLPNDIRSCIRQKGNEDETIFLKNMTISKNNGTESYFFEFTSPATENRAWRITYYNKGDNSLNFTQTNTAKKIARRDLFFNAVFNKFGYPSDGKNFIWGQKEDAFMQVSMYGSNYDAQITLTDTLLSDEDYFSAKDWLEGQAPLEHFNFGD